MTKNELIEYVVDLSSRLNAEEAKQHLADMANNNKHAFATLKEHGPEIVGAMKSAVADSQQYTA